MHCVSAHPECFDKTVSASQVYKRTDPLSHTNYRFLSTPEKIERLRNLHKVSRTATKKLLHLKQRLANVIEKQGVQLDGSTNSELTFDHGTRRLNFDGNPSSRRFIPETVLAAANVSEGA